MAAGTDAEKREARQQLLVLKTNPRSICVKEAAELAIRGFVVHTCDSLKGFGKATAQRPSPFRVITDLSPQPLTQMEAWFAVSVHTLLT
jgi:hypothetical protein